MNQAIQGLKPVLLAVLFAWALAPAALAQALTIPNTFTNNTAADATQVNANFAAVKTTVDAHNTAIAGKLTNSIADCPVGSAIRTIATNGTRTCQVVETGTGVASVAAVVGVSRFSTTNTNQVNAGGSLGRAGVTTDPNASDYLMIPISLPQGATVTGITYRVYDNSTTQQSTAYLYRAGPNSQFITSVGTGGTEVSTTVLVKSSSGTLSHLVDNVNYGYFAYLGIRSGTDASLIVPISFHVSYTY